MLHASAHEAIYAFHSYSQVLSRLHYTLDRERDAVSATQQSLRAFQP